MPDTKTIAVQYFAVYRQARGNGETLATHAENPRVLYDELNLNEVVPLDTKRLKVAVNDEFADWDTPLANGDSVVFIAPVAGG